MSEPRVRPFRVAVIGAGAAGLSAAMQLGRRGHSVVLIDPAGPGGQLLNAGVVDTLPGLPQGVTGPDLAGRMADQLDGFDVESVFAAVTNVRRSGHQLVVSTDDDQQLNAD